MKDTAHEGWSLGGREGGPDGQAEPVPPPLKKALNTKNERNYALFRKLYNYHQGATVGVTYVNVSNKTCQNKYIQ